MKRLNHLYEKIYSLDNLELADHKARKGKTLQYGIQVHDRTREQNLLSLQAMLINKTYLTSEYTTFTVREPKERIVFRLPYFPDRIAHHAIMNVLESVFTSVFTSDTYSCIKGKGIHGAANAVKEALRDVAGTRYCLKLDIVKFYPSVDHSILKALLRRKIKDIDLLWLLDGIIDSAPGLPIGNYLSQYLANFYLTYFDHWIKERKAVKYYFRYADDMVVFSGSKTSLHQLLADIRVYLERELKLSIKRNYQVFPVSADPKKGRGVDFVGYVFYHTHSQLRKSIKQNFARKVHAGATPNTIASYWGWAKHCHSKNLINKLSNESIQQNGHRARDKKFYRKEHPHRGHIRPAGSHS